MEFGSTDSKSKSRLGDLQKLLSNPNRRRKRVLILVAGLLLILVILILAISIPLLKYKTEETKLVCQTEGCATAAAMVQKSINPSVDPCENFFEFACGNWIKSSPIPDDEAAYSTFSQLRDKVTVQLKELFEEPVTDSTPKAVRTLKDLYVACSDEDTIEQLGTTPLLELVAELGGWPIVPSNGWDESNFDLVQLLANLRKYNNRYIVDAAVTVDDKNSSVYILKVDQFGLGLPSKDYYSDPNYASRLEAYRTFIRAVAIELGASTPQVDQDIEKLIAFEIAVANITVPSEERRDAEAMYNKMMVEELYTNVSSKFDWLRFFQLIFEPVNITITNQTELLNYEPEYFTALLDMVEETPSRVLANYVIWRIIKNRVRNLHQVFRDFDSDFNKAIYGNVSTPTRWKTCVAYANSMMGEAGGRLFVDRYFEMDAKSSAKSMISDVRKAFNDLLEEQDWMDNATRPIAKEKSNAIKEKIGYNEKIKDDAYLNEKYAWLAENSNRNTYFRNYINGLRFIALDQLSLLTQHVDKHKWSTDPAVVNAYYSSSRNDIAFPAGILQLPFWQKDRPMSMNFGAIGSVIGHEITHGFDDQGRQYDKDGNLVDWWSDDVIEKFKEKTECIKEQYGGYFVPQVNMSLNGINTLGENIADNGGIKQAYRAYEEWTKSNTDLGHLPGLPEYSQKQLFFIGFSQVWCSNFRDAALINSIKTGYHAPGKFRVIGTLSNFPQFSEVFNCPVNSTMNPSNKCSVW